MEISSSVKIGGHILKVIRTNDKNYIDENEIGKTFLAKNIIYINTDYPQSIQEEALIHEIMHNIFFVIDAEQSEELIRKLGFCLYQIIVDNKEIFN